MRLKGLEPSRRKTPDPKSGASAIPPRPRVHPGSEADGM